MRCAIENKQSVQDIVTSLRYLDSSPQASQTGCDDIQRKSKNKSSASAWLTSLWCGRIYAALVILIILGYSLRIPVYLLEETKLNFFTIILPNAWAFAAALTTGSIFLGCVRGDFDLFFRKWRALYQDKTTRTLGIRGVAQSKFVQRVVVIYWINIVLSTGTVLWMMLMDEQFSGGMNRTFYITGHRPVWVIVLTCVVITFIGFAWQGMFLLVVVLSRLVSSHFWEFGQVLKLHIAAACGGFPQHLKSLRECHLVMCETVALLDRFMKILLFMYYSSSVPQVCGLLYHLVKVPMGHYVDFINAVWLVWNIGITSVITYYLSNVNKAMHSVADDLYTIRTNSLSVNQLGQFQMFLAKVNGPSMGFTILGMVVITREFMLTLFGVYVTYCVVLLQFK